MSLFGSGWAVQRKCQLQLPCCLKCLYHFIQLFVFSWSSLRHSFTSSLRSLNIFMIAILKSLPCASTKLFSQSLLQWDCWLLKEAFIPAVLDCIFALGSGPLEWRHLKCLGVHSWSISVGWLFHCLVVVAHLGSSQVWQLRGFWVPVSCHNRGFPYREVVTED